MRQKFEAIYAYEHWWSIKMNPDNEIGIDLFLREDKHRIDRVVDILNIEWDKHTSPGWISVEDELPEPFTVVLATRTDGDIIHLASIDVCDNWTKVNYKDYPATPNARAYHTHLSKPTHWQPLPESPEKESDIGLPLPPQCVTDAMDKFARDVAKAARKRLEEQFINPLLDDLEQECHKTKTVVVTWDDNTTEITIRKVK